MIINMERQSVSMRDDRKAPNRKSFEVIGSCSLKSFIKILCESYCPRMYEEKAVWILWDRHKAIAVFDSITRECVYLTSRKNIALQDLTKKDDLAEMYLYYKGKTNIDDVVYELNEELIG
ncbi:hypothetical protein [uncultured Clostridium sp.]|uniref:hypothetical protein n=1 Tax=uncultured Clostridium sp. TaxID=59620 RepID=UPI0025E54C84|nr:hypothetical protein [uncultured Clostridium sp.]